jgi:hypothetical protein
MEVVPPRPLADCSRISWLVTWEVPVAVWKVPSAVSVGRPERASTNLAKDLHGHMVGSPDWGVRYFGILHSILLVGQVYSGPICLEEAFQV